MKKPFIVLFTLLSISLSVNAQKEYRLVKTTGHLKLNLNGAIVEGYDGKEIIFSNQDSSTAEVDERAKGLVPISSSGYTDNTGLGINVKESGQDIIVNNIFKNASEILKIKVPQGMKVSFTNNSSQNQEDIIIRNIKGEIEVSTNYNSIKLENNSGPMNISTKSGSVDASFSGEIKGPISIISIHDHVDITLPSGAKGNIELATNYGKLYAAKDLKIDLDTTGTEKMIKRPISTKLTGGGNATSNSVSITSGNTSTSSTTSVTSEGSVSIGSAYSAGDKIKGKLNGGGVDLIFKSINDNVYLRVK